jgi:hypothetical protein
MVRVLLLAALILAGCIDTKKCHDPTAWKVCAGESAQPGGGGTPPAILELTLPTCTFAEEPTVVGTMHATDPDGDVQVIKATFAVGPRINESEVFLPDAGRAGTEWSGAVGIAVMTSGGTVSEGTRDVRVKVTDAAGAQSVPYCNTLTVVK